MRFTELADSVNTPFVYTYQVVRLFSHEPKTSVKYQLSRWAASNKLIRLKRGLYLFPNREIDELALSALVYQPSYVSLETALNLYGIIPDIPTNTVTAVTTTTPNTFSTWRGRFTYSKMKSALYFGFTQQVDPQSRLSYSVAEPEKALLDWIYLRQVVDLEENRVDMGELILEKLKLFSQAFPESIRKIFQ